MMAFAPGDEKFFKAGAYLGKTGDRSCHLHYTPYKNGSAQPHPFVDFEASTDKGATWQPVVVGVPHTGMWVRRTKDIKFEPVKKVGKAKKRGGVKQLPRPR